jgi:predicted nucleic acid-binding protein
LLARPASPPIVVLDTNAFYGDVEGARTKLTAVLDGAEKGDFELIVPQVVLDELVKQYPKRIKQAARRINKAIGEQGRTLAELGITPPALFLPQRDGDAYRDRLTKRLRGSGAVVRQPPADISLALDWAIHRRKPFKETGEGLPDAVIWLTLLDLAVERAPKPVLLVTTNTKDFGDGSSPPNLATELIEDLRARGLRDGQVALIDGLDGFLERIARPLAGADRRAQRLLATADTRRRITESLERELDFRRLPANALHLGVPLEEDPQISMYEVGQMSLCDVAEVDEEHLLLKLEVEVDVTVEALVFKADAYGELEDSYVDVVDANYNDHYVEVSADVSIVLSVETVTDLEARSVEIEVEAVHLASVERASRALRGRLDTLLDGVNSSHNQAGGEIEVSGYLPDIPLLSDLTSASLTELRSATLRRLEVDEVLDDDELAIRVSLEGEGDVDWIATALHPADIDGAESVEHGGGIRQDMELFVPLVLEVTAVLELPDRLRDITIESVAMSEATAAERQAEREEADPEFQRLREWAEAHIEAEGG